MTSIVTTAYGKVQGVDCGTYRTYFGVPFAKAPVGELRFEAPVKPDAYEGVLVADHFREKAYQQELGDLQLWGKEFYQNPEYNVQPSEDCLYMNIWAPKRCEGKCPVAVWIHGGAFKNGYPSEMEFDGKAFAEKGVILVTIAYRCNLFGFLPTPGEGNRLNLGLQDQIMAIKWVKENIGAFGGEADNITIFGQSAGAMSVQYLCCSPAANGLFQKAIMQSGATYRSAVGHMMDLATGRQVYEELLKACQCSNLQELKTVPAAILYETFDRLPIMQQVGMLSPVKDEYVCPHTVDEAIDLGLMHQIPILCGVNKDDMWMENATQEQPNGELWEGTKRLCEVHRERGNAAFLYYFAHDLPGNNEGAFHSAELWYVFGTLGRSWRPMTEQDYALSEEMVTHWTDFCKTGKPDGDAWKAWPEGYHSYL